MSKVQPKLFSTAVGNACGWKVFVGTNNREVRYFNVDDRIARVDIGAGKVPVSVQSHGRHDVVIPGYGQVQERAGSGGKTFLGRLAMVREVIEAQKATDEARAREKQVTATLLKLTAKGEVDKGLNRTKLCHKPEAPAGHFHTFIPAKHGLSFAKIPIEFTQHQYRLAKDEFRVLQAAWVLASHSGEFYGEDKLSRMAKVHPKNLSAIRKSLANRCLIRRTGRREHNSDVWKLVWNPDYYGEYAEREADCTEGSKFSDEGSKFNRSVDEYATNKRREENQNTKIFVGSTGCRSGGPFSCDEEKSFEDDGEGVPVRVINFP